MRGRGKGQGDSVSSGKPPHCRPFAGTGEVTVRRPRYPYLSLLTWAPFPRGRLGVCRRK